MYEEVKSYRPVNFTDSTTQLLHESSPSKEMCLMHLVRGSHPGVELRANLESISKRCYLFEVAFVWELSEETIHLPLIRLQGGEFGVYVSEFSS